MKNKHTILPGLILVQRSQNTCAIVKWSERCTLGIDVRFLIGIYLANVLLVLVLITSFTATAIVRTDNETNLRSKRPFLAISKYQMIQEINQAAAQITRLEQSTGYTDPAGYRIYTPRETARLFDLYRKIKERIRWLNADTGEKSVSWNGYPIIDGDFIAYEPSRVQKSIRELVGDPQLRPLLQGYRVYLAPFHVPETAGFGGAGFSILWALPATMYDPERLPETLYHEIGHHLHLSRIESDGLFWEKYHQIRGGHPQGPGPVNTPAWGLSSEETLAEDFRMLFGKNQPYYGDLALGDPRDDPKKATMIKSLLLELINESPSVPYQSPWRPDQQIRFWRMQIYLIAALWAALLFGILHLRRKNRFTSSHVSQGRMNLSPLYRID